MEASLRFLNTAEFGNKPVLGFRGKKHAHCIVNDETSIRVINVELRDFDRSPVLKKGASPYPLDLFVSQMTGIGARKGITQRARSLLDRAMIGVPDEEEEDFESEDAPEPATNGHAAPQQAEPRKAAAPVPAGKPPPAPGSRRNGPPAKPVRASRAAPKAPLATAPVPREAGSDLIRATAARLKLDPPKLRKLLRSEGLRAPYDDEAAIKRVLNKLGVK